MVYCSFLHEKGPKNTIPGFLIRWLLLNLDNINIFKVTCLINVALKRRNRKIIDEVKPDVTNYSAKLVILDDTERSRASAKRDWIIGISDFPELNVCFIIHLIFGKYSSIPVPLKVRGTFCQRNAMILYLEFYTFDTSTSWFIFYRILF